MSQKGLSEVVSDEVLANLFRAVVEEMALFIRQSAYTTFVRETNDFSTALVTPAGETFAYPRSMGVVMAMGTSMAPVIDQMEWSPGDICVTNDPFASKGMVTHLNDLHFLRPVFSGDTLLCFVWSFLHLTDVGGSVPGSIDMVNSEVIQEGIRLRPVKLYQGDTLNAQIWDVMRDNSRIPDLNWGDLSAATSAMRRGEQRVRSLLQRYGADALRHAMYSSLDQSEALTRQVLSRIPKGEYSFTEYFEDDYVSDIPVRIEVCLRSTGEGDIELDFAGTDPQVRSALNFPAGNQPHHPVLSRAIVGYILTYAPDIRYNSGILRCITLTLPEGSIVNSVAPAAVGMRVVTSMKAHDAILGALIQATPGELPVGGAGHVVITYVYMREHGGNGRVVVANPIQGGSGASGSQDGLSGSDRPTAHLRSVPAEVLEGEVPVLVRRFGLVPDSEGAGEFRGGFGVEFHLEALRPEMVIVMRGKDRHRFTPWGAMGGEAGTNATCYVRQPAGNEEYLGKRTFYQPDPGQVIVIKGPGGGGYGNPLRRDPEAVRADYLNDLITRERAAEAYGVILRPDGKLDHDATRDARKRVVAGDGLTFALGAARLEWEAKFQPAAGTITQLLLGLPLPLRDLGRVEIHKALMALGEGPYSPDDARRVAHDVFGSSPEGPRPGG